MKQMGNNPYKLFSNNCNHFTQRAAMAAGARLPAQIHNTREGPYGAHLNLGEAASECAGENAQNAADGTRFFQGGHTRSGQMAEEFKLLITFFLWQKRQQNQIAVLLGKVRTYQLDRVNYLQRRI